ncbi:helix-turn-helix domain-containing protein [Paenibacillus contaminans]|uniref:HTH araC/xylS-type domain-containing protein n=1 Tax=Paenibacillus contaminans TaxID=450362 RepID=A0A329LZK8_9BACL|nr:AraC family transcriptional regulator [Paenibacillus contaminans]RAV11873.1 hypothetical protein DQG23_35410 [Paenibacillus contaminans]
MPTRKPFPFKRNSLFIKLLGGFVGLTALLLSFNFFTFAFFSDNLEKEIIRNNRSNLSNAVERFENHFQIIQNTVVHLYFSDKVALLNETGNSLQIDPVNQVVDEIKTITNNDFLFLDNIILQFHKNDFTIDKAGPSQTDLIFTEHYISKEYAVPFWREQLDQSYKMKLFPQADFSDKKKITNRTLLPFIIKNKAIDQFYIAAMLNAEKMFAAFYNSNQTNFYMFDEEGRQLYRSSAEPPGTGLAADFASGFTDAQDYVKRDDYYLFHKRGTLTGTTYVSVVPNTIIAGEMSRFNMVLFSMSVVAVTLSVFISVVLSIKFNNPIKQIMNAIQKHSTNSPLQSKIDEYQYIYDNVNRFMQAKKDIDGDLKRNLTQLRYFRYMRKAKSIYSGDSGLPDDDKPFYLAVFHLTATERFGMLAEKERDRAMSYIREYIHIALSERFDDPVTLQIEKDQILSLIFCEQESADLLPMLDRLKLVFDQDKDFCYFTIAVKPVLRSPSDFTAAYEETLEMVNRRKLGSETQIIVEMPSEPLVAGFTPAQEQEFLAYLQAGQETNAVSVVTRQLYRMENMDTTAQQYADFVKEIVAKTIKTMLTMNLDISSVLDAESPYRKIKECVCLQNYVELCERFLSEAIRMIVEKKEGTDPIKHLLMKYVSEHYDKDISLEMVADELGVSIHYVSKYFKEKTGMNFLDYVAELRLRKAKELLLSTKHKIQDIAEQVGYYQVNSFIRMFRKATGLSPGEYRRQRGGEDMGSGSPMENAE